MGKLRWAAWSQAGAAQPTLFGLADTYKSDALLLVSLAEGPPISLTAQQVTQMPWRQFVRLMKVQPAERSVLQAPGG